MRRPLGTLLSGVLLNHCLHLRRDEVDLLLAQMRKDGIELSRPLVASGCCTEGRLSDLVLHPVLGYGSATSAGLKGFSSDSPRNSTSAMRARLFESEADQSSEVD